MANKNARTVAVRAGNNHDNVVGEGGRLRDIIICAGG